MGAVYRGIACTPHPPSAPSPRFAGRRLSIVEILLPFKGTRLAAERRKNVAHGESHGNHDEAIAREPRSGDRRERQTYTLLPSFAAPRLASVHWFPTAGAVGYILSPLRG